MKVISGIGQMHHTSISHSSGGSLEVLSRGHPIGASGAVLVCDLFDNLPPGQIGLAMIPAAGGLASGLLVRRPSESP